MATNNTVKDPLFVFMILKESDNKNGLEKVKKNATICWIYLLPKKIDIVRRIGKEYKDRNSGKKS